MSNYGTGLDSQPAHIAIDNADHSIALTVVGRQRRQPLTRTPFSEAPLIFYVRNLRRLFLPQR